MIFIGKPMAKLRKLLGTFKYGNPFYERSIGDQQMFQTVGELKDAERIPSETGRINWEVWDRVVTDTRRQLQELGSTARTKKVFAYDLDGGSRGCFSSVTEASEALGIGKSTIVQCCLTMRPNRKNSTVLSYFELTPEDVMHLQQDAGTRTEKLVYDLEGRLIGRYGTIREVSQEFQIDRSTVQYHLQTGTPHRKRGIIIKKGN